METVAGFMERIERNTDRTHARLAAYCQYVWSSDACIGYMCRMLEEYGLPEEQIKRAADKMRELLSEMGPDEAEACADRYNRVMAYAAKLKVIQGGSKE